MDRTVNVNTAEGRAEQEAFLADALSATDTDGEGLSGTSHATRPEDWPVRYVHEKQCRAQGVRSYNQRWPEGDQFLHTHRAGGARREM